MRSEAPYDTVTARDRPLGHLVLRTTTVIVHGGQRRLFALTASTPRSMQLAAVGGRGSAVRA